ALKPRSAEGPVAATVDALLEHLLDSPQGEPTRAGSVDRPLARGDVHGEVLRWSSVCRRATAVARVCAVAWLQALSPRHEETALAPGSLGPTAPSRGPGDTPWKPKNPASKAGF
ncbi:MAG: hypothetical protein AB8H79_19945, partial [Myxococcota bacterium]